MQLSDSENVKDFAFFLWVKYKFLKLHEEGSPYTLPVKVSVLTYWGKLRSWTCGGHFHEHPELDLINLLESLSGLPVEVEFIDFEDLKAGRFTGNVILNAGSKNSAWSGGDVWKEASVVERLTQFVYEGGIFIAVNESSEVDGFDTNLRMASLLGVDLDRGDFLCHGSFSWQEEESELQAFGQLEGKKEAFIHASTVKVLKTDGDTFAVTENTAGEGKAIYMSSYRHNPENAGMLLRLLCKEEDRCYISDNPYVECAYYPESAALVWINNSDRLQEATMRTERGSVQVTLKALETKNVKA